MSVEKGRFIEYLRPTYVTDWSGQLLSKKARHLVCPGMIVRCLSEYTLRGGAKARREHNDHSLLMGGDSSYYRIVKVKDGSVWGEVMSTYRDFPEDSYLFPTGKICAFRKENISEIPIWWQPKRIQKQLKRHVVRDKGLFMTGWTTT